MPAYGRRLHPEVRAFLEDVVSSVPVDFGGGSGSAKALVLADLIARFGITDTVEIGVYRGRSLLPVAAMLRVVGGGVATGIDPWSVDEALQQDEHVVGPRVNDWVRSHPWEDRAAVERDAELYVPKLRPGGFLVLDDASWDSIRPVAEALRSELDVVFQLCDFLAVHEDQASDFLVLRVPS
jgi:hypothetical protein